MTVRAATIDELLSDDFEPLPGQKEDADRAARRLAAWCRSCASGDWSLFGRRLERDGLTLAEVLARFATLRRKASTSAPAWVDDAIWIEAALQRPALDRKPLTALAPGEPCAFEQLFTPLVEQAGELLRAGIDARAFGNLSEAARDCLSLALLKRLSDLCAAALYERFDKARKADAPSPDAAASRRSAGTRYDRFVAEMRAGGFRRLFEDKPVLLRLIACVTRQWIDTSRELVLRLDADLGAIRRDLLRSSADGGVAGIEGDLSDPHNGGHSVQVVSFEDGSRIAYKPKDLRVDVAWHDLIERLNRADPPVELKAMRTIARAGYGWTEFVDHAAGTDREGCSRFFRRAGAWLALFHCFAATDMHQENMIAAGDHPVPIDLEMILQATADERKAQDPEGQAFGAATEIIANSVLTVGLLPAYGRTPDNKIFAVGAMTADQNAKTKLQWTNINSDEMRPAKSKEVSKTSPNLPHVGGSYGKFGDHFGDFIAGFEEYAKFLRRQTRSTGSGRLFDGFAGLPIRKVLRPTQFYYLLLQRLKDHRAMEDGAIWSAQADFIARLVDWDKDSNPLWPLQRRERAALLALNVPHFVSPSDSTSVEDASGFAVRTQAIPGLDRARARAESLDEDDIAWQIDVIRHSTSALSRSGLPPPTPPELKEPSGPAVSAAEIFTAETDRIAAELSRQAIRRGPGAAWIGLDWLGDSEVFQLVCLGPDLYNGVSGISLFLAAHAAATGCGPSAELALAGVAHLRKDLRSRNAPRLARSLGIGAAAGLGSIVYALTAMSKSLDDEGLLADAHVAAELFSDELIAADQRLDVIAGSAGAILGLLRLYRDTRSGEVLARASKCGEHLLRQKRIGPDGRRSWIGQGFGPRALNGMSHGAAGFAYALALLAAATGREEFAQAAAECIAFENSSYDPGRSNWPDLRGVEPSWLCQWCYGAVGIGMARLAASRRGAMDARAAVADIRNAIDGAKRGWPGAVDTLCCGTLGTVEFFCEAADALEQGDLGELASQRLLAVLRAAASAGDYRWNGGGGRFNLGLFRGLAGVGYTLLRRIDSALPNVLIWE
ncbi:MAG: type 2 lanthipeptide synthetase LanM family protein [Xanthobacteraceae bacterium]